MSQADDLVAIALDRYQLGVDDNGEPYAVPRLGSSVVTMLRGRKSSLREELAAAHYSDYGKVPTSNSLADALRVIEGRCRDEEPEHVFLRTARVAGDIHVDLGRNENEQDPMFVWIRSDGTWRLTPMAPVRFRRTNQIAPMPIPTPGDNIEELYRFVNLPVLEFRLFVAWLIAGFFEDIPHPALVIGGTQGTGKSTLARIARTLLDPSPAPLCSMVKSSTSFSRPRSCTLPRLVALYPGDRTIRSISSLEISSGLWKSLQACSIRAAVLMVSPK